METDSRNCYAQQCLAHMSYRTERSAVRNLEDRTQRTTCGKDSGFRVFDKVSVFDEVNEHSSTLRWE